MRRGATGASVPVFVSLEGVYRMYLVTVGPGRYKSYAPAVHCKIDDFRAALAGRIGETHEATVAAATESRVQEQVK